MLTGMQIARRAKEQLAELTGLKPETVSSLTKDEDGWSVTVDIIELKRIPEATDVLATYEAKLDANGDVVSYQRTRRYNRSSLEEKQA